MVSTYLSYRLYAKDMAASLKREAADPSVSRETAYYNANIGNIKSVDDLLKNDRLFTYAMNASGLGDMAKSKAFMKKVLLSDLTDPKSFARKLVDPRYVAFARLFNFTADGKANGNTPLAQSGAQEDKTVKLYSEHRIRQGDAAAADAAYYESKIKTLTSVDQLLADERMLKVALEAFDIDPKFISQDALRATLTGDNKLGSKGTALHAAFSFAADGSVPDGQSAQVATAIKTTVLSFFDKTGNAASPKAAAYYAEYYRTSIAPIKSVDELVANRKAVDFALVAAGLNPSFYTDDGVKTLLTKDPASFGTSDADQMLKLFRTSFNFENDGTLASGQDAQSEAQVDATVNRYLDKYDDAAAANDKAESDYYKKTVTGVSSTGGPTSFETSLQVVSDRRILAYLIEAYDLDPEVSSSDVERALRDGATVTAELGDPKLGKLADDFNFDKDGKVTTATLAQSEKDSNRTAQLYAALVPANATAADKAAAKAEITFYQSQIQTVKTAADLVADKRLKEFVLKAFKIDPKTVTDADLKSVLTSDVLDPKSFARTSGKQSYVDLAGAFNFDSKGNLKPLPVLEAQSRANIAKTDDQMLVQTLETKAGKDNEGVRLALYFQRKAPTLTSSLDILADKALIQVVKTALQLPDQFSQLPLEKQEKLIDNKLDVEDLKDPAKLDKFITRFASFYDQQTSTGGQSSALQLFNTRGSTGFSETLLGQIQRLKIR